MTNKNETAIVPDQDKIGATLVRANKKNTLVVISKKLEHNDHEQLRKALPDGIDPVRYKRLVVTMVKGSEDLMKCTEESLLSAVMTGAQLGLEFDGVLGEAYLAPFFNNRRQVYEAKFIAGYKGKKNLVYQSGMVKKIIPRAVYEGDEFDFMLGTEEWIRHRQCAEPISERLTYVYAVAWLVNSDMPIFDVMSRSEIDLVKSRARGSKNKDSAWNTSFAEMARKTVFNRLVKYLPQSSTNKVGKILAASIALESLSEVGIGACGKDKRRTVSVEQVDNIDYVADFDPNIDPDYENLESATVNLEDLPF